MYRLIGKRIIDITLSIIGLFVLFVPMAIIAVLIKLDSKGEAIFVQKRWGKKRKEFSIYKFRTMIPNAYEKGGLVLSEDDERITKVGAFLRKSSLDELPQMINIIKGDMSIIGPRPCLPHEYDEYEGNENFRKRFNVLPGLFCSVDVELRASADFDTQFRMDSEYIDNITLKNDLKVFLGVIKTVLLGKNVYRKE